MQSLFDTCVENLKNMSSRAGYIEDDKFKCTYMSPEGKKCIVGQLFDDETASLLEQKHPGASICSIDIDPTTEAKYPFLKDYDNIIMLNSFQVAHDCEDYWHWDEEVNGFYMWYIIKELGQRFGLDVSKVPQQGE